MKPLDKEYQITLQEIASQIPTAEAYLKYQEEEEEEDYQQLRDEFEPLIKALYVKVAKSDPLQLHSLEKHLLNPVYEGMFLPRILGYTVLRGQINEEYKYTLPQEHFKEVLLTICNSSNFEYLRKRIGQTIQMGFGLSSDIWVTNLINDVVIKQVRYFLQSQKLPRYRDLRERRIGYVRYSNQFKSDYYRYAPYPKSPNEMKLYYPGLLNFLHYRVQTKLSNKSLVEPTMAIIKDPAFHGTYEHVVITGLFAGYFNLKNAEQEEFKTILNQLRKERPEINDLWLRFILETHEADINMDGAAELNIASYLDKSIRDEIAEYYTLMETVHSKGYIHDDAIEAVKVFYANHEGMSVINHCVRQTILNYIKHFLQNIEPAQYAEYFELSKIFPTYMGIFSNQQFNQDLKALCMAYIKRCLRQFTDKRGKDYQDIKKFVNTNFLDLEFMTKKELLEFFKTRRKRKAAATTK